MCCKPDGPETWYPVTADTDCAGSTPPVAGQKCVNRHGNWFECAERDTCCGDICVAEGGTCCQNVDGNDFACGVGDSCCGNACAAEGSKCCKPKGQPKREWYPVTEDSDCAGSVTSPTGSQTCKNRYGHEFLCGENDLCCGDICVAEGGTCCQNVEGNDFACGAGDSCCGNACAAKGSKCCKQGLPKSEWYPVSDDSECAGSLLAKTNRTIRGQKICRNRDGYQFECAEKDTCCGDICVAEGGTCCQNVEGNDFAYAAGDSCCGNACSADGSKCCKPKGQPASEWYPVSDDTDCAGSVAASSQQQKCNNRHGDEFLCAENDICCGDICVAVGGTCCQNVEGNDFGCGAGASCCGNACAAEGSKCCKPDGPETWYPVTADTDCAGSTPPVAGQKCVNRRGNWFECAEKDTCCGD